MSPLVRELLVHGLMAGTAVRKAKKSSIDVAYYMIGGVFGVIGVVFLSLAGFGLLREIFTLPGAAAITGAVLLAVGGAVIIISDFVRNGKKPLHKPSFDNSFLDGVEQSVKSMMDGLEEPVRDNPKMALLLAALAGFAAGDQIGDKIRH